MESEEELGECESEAERQVRSVKSVSNFVTRVGVEATVATKSGECWRRHL